MSPAEQVARPCEQIERAKNACYFLDAPEISDAECDHLFRELQAFEAAYTTEMKIGSSQTIEQRECGEALQKI